MRDAALPWQKLSQETFKAAEKLYQEQSWRACVNRSYYAAYQSCTSAILRTGKQPPVVDGIQRESWGHAITPKLMQEFVAMTKEEWRTKQMASLLFRLRDLRVDADYKTMNIVSFDQKVARNTLRASGQIRQYVARTIWSNT